MSEPFEASFSIPATHPALPGHFPGAAVVPGVVLLEQVLQAAESRLATPVSVRGIPHVKFSAPLLPGTDARALLKLESAKLSFRIECAGRTIAQGTFLLRAEHTS